MFTIDYIILSSLQETEAHNISKANAESTRKNMESETNSLKMKLVRLMNKPF